MAGSFSHITAGNGMFRADLIENMRDARQALEECHQVIAALLGEYPGRREQHLAKICRDLSYPMPAAAPVIEPRRHGVDSIYRKMEVGRR